MPKYEDPVGKLMGKVTVNQPPDIPKGTIRKFDTGATRDTDEGKNDYEGFLSPTVIKRFGDYMTKHRRQSDGSLRDSDNWQKGIPMDAYMKSAWRHFHEWWASHRGNSFSPDDIEDTLCAMLFNVQGYLHELLKQRYSKPDEQPEKVKK